MKRSRLNLLAGGSATIAFAVAGIPVPGCETLLRDPQAFFAENTCNLFNCDTLFFLEEEHGEVPDGHDEPEPEVNDQ